jgi:putative SOS response-associated peptidase YedK
MCCRYQLLREHLNKVLESLGVRGISELGSRYNIAPGTKIPAVRERPKGKSEAPSRELAELRWGLIPEWSKDEASGAGLVNARAESLEAKPSFREAFRARRCLIPASGFYEWKVAGRARLPWLFQLPDEEPFFLAGLWESWRAPDGVELETCAVITTEPNCLMQPIHHRMPAILPLAAGSAWIDPTAKPEELRGLLMTFPAEQLRAREVSSRVNAVANDDAGCLAPAEPVGGTAETGQALFDL